MRDWFSGRMTAFQAVDKGSIPLSRTRIKLMNNPRTWISNEDYVFIFSKVPRVCVDVVIKNKEGILLTLRSIDPYKGNWHLPGGMVYKSESFHDAAKRIVKSEVGLDVSSVKIIDTVEILNEERPDHVQHIISMICEAEVQNGELRGDFQSSELKYFMELPENIIPIHREVLDKVLKI